MPRELVVELHDVCRIMIKNKHESKRKKHNELLQQFQFLES